jgi:hypothetical protein
MVFLPMYTKKHLGLAGLRKVLAKRFSRLSDHREEDVDHSMHDVFMSAYAMMHFQDPSLLQFERMLQSSRQGNNLTTIFTSIPSDTQMRDIMDEAESGELEPILDDFFRLLRRAKHLEEYRACAASASWMARSTSPLRRSAAHPALPGR